MKKIIILLFALFMLPISASAMVACPTDQIATSTTSLGTPAVFSTTTIPAIYATSTIVDFPASSTCAFVGNDHGNFSNAICTVTHAGHNDWQLTNHAAITHVARTLVTATSTTVLLIASSTPSITTTMCVPDPSISTSTPATSTPPVSPSPSPIPLPQKIGSNGPPDILGLVSDGHGNYTRPTSCNDTPKNCQLQSLYRQLILLLTQWIALLRH